MKKPKTITTTSCQSVGRVLLATVLILLVPFLAMQFTTEVDWTLFDFLIMGALLFGTGLAINLATRMFTRSTHRYAAVTFIVLLFLFIWAELAVGILNIPGISGS